MNNSVTFKVWDWKDIMRVCGSVLSNEKGREMLHYIKIRCEDNYFKAYGTNGYQVSTIEGKCEMKDKDSPIEVMIPPQKTPAKTDTVELNTYVEIESGKAPVHILYCYGEAKNITGNWNIQIINGEYPDLEDMVIKPAFGNIGGFNHGQGQYMIAVNPHYLLAALEGMKDCKSVILNFGSQVQAFLIRPYEEGEQNVTALVFPVRLMHGGRGV